MNTCLRIAGIIRESIVDGPGIRMVVFAQGCKHKCPGCHNPETHSFDGGTLVTINSVIELAKKILCWTGLRSAEESPLNRLKRLPPLPGRPKSLTLI